jgi:hypothetical protein
MIYKNEKEIIESLIFNTHAITLRVINGYRPVINDYESEIRKD